MGWWSPAPTSPSAVRPPVRATELRASESTAATAMTAMWRASPAARQDSAPCCCFCLCCSTVYSSSRTTELHHANKDPSATQTPNPPRLILHYMTFTFCFDLPYLFKQNQGVTVPMRAQGALCDCMDYTRHVGLKPFMGSSSRCVFQWISLSQ